MISLDTMNKNINWLELNGFRYEHCFIRKIGTWNYKGYSWTLEDIKSATIEVFQEFKKFYDEEITEKQLKEFLKTYKTNLGGNVCQ